MRPRLPRPTVRLRLTLVYGGLFLACGAALVAITYVLMVHATSGFIFSNETGSFSTVRTGSSAVPTVKDRQLHVLTAPGPQLSPAQLQAQMDQLEAQAHTQHAAELHQLLLQSGIALAVMSVISIALGWVVAGRVLRKLRTITAAVQQISATNLHERLALTGPDDELKELGDTFDALVGRLERSFAAQRRFVANASHELRTPLARQRTLGQVALADPDASIESLRAAHERVLAAGAQQEQLIEALLALARGQAGVDRRRPIDLASVIERLLAARQDEAKYRGVRIDADLDAALTAGDPRLVERLVSNLIDNGLRHNIAHGHLVVRTTTRNAQVIMSLSNTGPDVPTDAVEGLFQPFRRHGADRTGEGLGLGLSIVRAIADSHGATVEARPGARGGLQVDVCFSAAPAGARELVSVPVLPAGLEPTLERS